MVTVLFTQLYRTTLASYPQARTRFLYPQILQYLCDWLASVTKKAVCFCGWPFKLCKVISAEEAITSKTCFISGTSEVA